MTSLPDPAPAPGAQRLWDRLVEVADEHFEVVRWRTEHGTPPMMVSLVDRASGEALTIAPVDQPDTGLPDDPGTVPVVVLAMSAHDGSLSVHGPLTGFAEADAHAAQLSTPAGHAVAATCPVVLHPPQYHIDVWMQLPDPVGRNLQPPPVPAPGAGPVALVLINRTNQAIAAVGPFACATDAYAWPPAGHQPDHQVDRLVAALT